MRDSEPSGAGAFERFEAAVLADAALQQELAAFVEDGRFVAAALAAAEERGMAVVRDDLESRLSTALERRAAPDPASERPPGDWLPAAVVTGGDGTLLVDWAHFAGAPLVEPFYGISLQRARARPFNRVFRVRTPLVTANAALRQPNGLIFHQSRCGSTAVARMLGALPRSTSVSEPAPVDAVVQQAVAGRLSLEEAVAALRAVVGAFGNRPDGEGGPLFVKLDSWHSRALPLFPAAFPETPWLFLFREPVEILVSQMRQRGPQTVPEMMHPSWYALEAGPEAPKEVYCAAVLARIAESALVNRGVGRGLFVDYAELPAAVAEVILPHFGIEADAAARAAMTAAAARDAKSPHERFAPDAESKRHEASEAVRAAAETHMRHVYEALVEAAGRPAA